MLGSLATGPLLDSGRLRMLLSSGTFLIVFGLMMTSISREYWQVLLSQGLIVGLGHSCLFIPGVAIIPTYFNNRRALAMGVGISGSSVGKLGMRSNLAGNKSFLT